MSAGHDSLHPRVLIGALVIWAAGLSVRATQAWAQDAEPQQAAEVESDRDSAELKPTEIGIRFTPQMSSAITKKFVDQMKPRYGLDEAQAEEISEVMRRQFMKFARENAEVGRDMVEMMMAVMIEHDGRFPKDEAKDFAKLAAKFTPKLKEFMTESSAQIGKKMSIKQRLQFTGDVGLAAAGMVIFENRMKRWEEGKIGDFANPFFDPADDNPSKAEPEPVDPSEHSEHRKARKEVETWIDWQIDRSKQWATYVEQAGKYYEFSETQKTSAQAVLKDCLERARTIRTSEWDASVKENRVLRNLTYKLGSDYSGGPWMAGLDESFSRLMKPLNDLDTEFKHRIDELADSAQRAKARERLRQALADKGVKQLPP